MDPGTAIAIVGLVLDGVKDVYEYYTTWKDRDEDVAEVRSALLWLKGLFVSIETTLTNGSLDKNQVRMICDSVKACEDVIEKLRKRLNKVKRETPPDTFIKKVSDQGRRALYPFQKGTIMRLLESVEKIRDQMHVVIALLNLDTASKSLRVLEALEENVTNVSGKVDVMSNVVLDEAQEKHRRSVMDWLSPTDQSEIHEAASRRHEPGTGQWFLGSDTFQNWSKDLGTSLWLYGEAGCGKTVLFSSIVNKVHDTQQSIGSTNSSAFFYCLYQKGTQHELSSILRTFIAQLCPQDHIPLSLQGLFDRHKRKFPPGIATDDELKETLLAILQDIGPSSKDSEKWQESRHRDRYLLIDALDELPLGSGRDQIIGYLNELASMHIPNLHILATSRNESDISNGLRSWDPPLIINKAKVAQDIKLYVTNEMQKDYDMSRQKETIKELIMHRLVEDGNGMFRWAALQLEELKALRPMKPRSISQALKSLPKDLDETYERILTKIPAGNSQQALSLLKWISFATRPLFIEEIMDVCAIQLGADPEFDTEERFTPRDILDLLPGLITIDPPLKVAESPMYSTHIVTFSHFSVQEYLTGSRISSSAASSYALEATHSNHFIGRVSIAYLSCCNTFALRKEEFPLRGYAWDYWAWHAGYQPGKTNEDLNVDAEKLFTSITQPDLTNSQLALRNLKSRLSDVASWNRQSTPQETRQEEDAIRIPFFYPEFAEKDWKAYEDSHKGSLINYKFDPLIPEKAEIRLVELFPSSKKFTEIRCRVFHAPLDSKPAYDGVSYASDPHDSAYLRANGLLLQVPRQLIADLRNLRAKTGYQGRVLFIYAVFFEDIKGNEEEWQLKLMARIFKQAQQVAIGLGDKSEADADAIEFVREIASLSTSDDRGGTVPLKSKTSLTHKYWSEDIGKSILSLFQRAWWRRMWTVQELMLPRKATLYYGDEAITFDTFQCFFEMEDKIEKLIGRDFYLKLISDKAWIGAKRVSQFRTRYLLGQYPTLPGLLWATQFHISRTPEAKVYALIGILGPDEQSSELLVHDKSLSDEDNFINVAIHILTKYNTLDLLSYAGCHRSEELSKSPLPTWVPDFSSLGQTVKPLVQGMFGPPESKPLFSAGVDRPFQLHIEKHSKVLLVQGFSIGTIQSTYGDPLTGTETKAALLDILSTMERKRPEMKVPDHEGTLEAFWRIIQADQRDGRRLGQLQRNVDKDYFIQDSDLDLVFCNGRVLAFTAEGRLCLAAAESRVGDTLVVLVGGNVPYILRADGEEYTFVGECYVHGIMDKYVGGTRGVGRDSIERFSII